MNNSEITTLLGVENLTEFCRYKHIKSIIDKYCEVRNIELVQFENESKIGYSTLMKWGTEELGDKVIKPHMFKKLFDFMPNIIEYANPEFKKEKKARIYNDSENTSDEMREPLGNYIAQQISHIPLDNLSEYDIQINIKLVKREK